MSSFIMPQMYDNINKSTITGFAEYDRILVMEMAEKTILDILVEREQMLNDAKEEESRLIANHREDMKKRWTYRWFGRNKELSYEEVYNDLYSGWNVWCSKYEWDELEAEAYRDKDLKKAREILSLAESATSDNVWLTTDGIRAISK